MLTVNPTLTNIKIRVKNELESTKVQTYLLTLGCSWASGLDITYTKKVYIYVTDKILSHGSNREFFESHKNTEVELVTTTVNGSVCNYLKEVIKKKEFIFKIEKGYNGLVLYAYDPITKKICANLIELETMRSIPSAKQHLDNNNYDTSAYEWDSAGKIVIK